MAVIASSNRMAGRVSASSVHDLSSPLVTDTTASTSSAAGPGTMVQRTSRSTGSPGRQLETVALGGSWSTMLAKRAASVSLPAACTTPAARTISSAVSAARGWSGRPLAVAARLVEVRVLGMVDSA